MARILVAFYSRTGTTRRIAGEVASALGADLLAITDVRSRAGFLGYLRSGREAMQAKLPEIAPLTTDPVGYDLVVLGTPVWAAHLSSPMRRFLHDHGRDLPRVAFFCTYGGSGSPQVFAQMRQLTGKDPEATCALLDRDIAAGKYRRALAEFVGHFGGAAPAQAA